MDSLLHIDSIQKRLWSHVCRVINGEIRGLCSKANPSILRKTDKESLTNFNWTALNEEWMRRGPHFLQVIQGAAYNVTAMETIFKKTKEAVLPAILSAGCKIVAVHNRDVSALRRITSVLLKKGGLKKFAFRFLEHTYDTVDYVSVIQLFDAFGANFDQKLLAWQKDVVDATRREKHLEQQIAQLSQLSDPSVKLQVEVMKSDLSCLRKNMHPGYSFTSDNVDVQVKVRHMTKANQNKDYHLYNMIAYKNRISANELADDVPSLKIGDIPLTTFLPDTEENRHYMEEFAYLIARVWATHIPALQWFSPHIQSHIAHEHEQEVKKKTERVSYCIFNQV